MRQKKFAIITTDNVTNDIFDMASSSDDKPDKLLDDVRKRTLTEKGWEYQLNLKIKSSKAKRREVITQVKSTLLLRGQSENVHIIKQELSKSQVLLGVFHDIFDELRNLAIDENELHEVTRIKEQTEREWVDFEKDIKSEITYFEQLNIEQQKLEVCSRASSKSKKSNRSSV